MKARYLLLILTFILFPFLAQADTEAQSIFYKAGYAVGYATSLILKHWMYFAGAGLLLLAAYLRFFRKAKQGKTLR